MRAMNVLIEPTGFTGKCVFVKQKVKNENLFLNVTSPVSSPISSPVFSPVTSLVNSPMCSSVLSPSCSMLLRVSGSGVLCERERVGGESGIGVGYSRGGSASECYIESDRNRNIVRELNMNRSRDWDRNMGGGRERERDRGSDGGDNGEDDNGNGRDDNIVGRRDLIGEAGFEDTTDTVIVGSTIDYSDERICCTVCERRNSRVKKIILSI